MGKNVLLKLFLGGAALGVAAAAAYSYIKNYKELAPKTEGGDAEGVDGEEVKRSYQKIDMNVAKEAAKQTFEDFKDGSKKAWGVACDSAKAVSGIVMENYGDQINGAKEKVQEAARNVKDFAEDKFDIAKDKISETWGDIKTQVTDKSDIVKDKVAEKLNEFKESFTEKVENFKEENPQILEGVEKVKQTAQEAFETVKEKVSDFVSNQKDDNGFEITDDDVKVVVDEVKEEVETATEDNNV